MNLDKHDLFRNAVPGFVFLVVILSFYAFTQNLDKINENQKALVLAVSGFPLGFIIYAIYRITLHFPLEQPKLEQDDMVIIRKILPEGLDLGGDCKNKGKAYSLILLYSLTREENIPWRERIEFLFSYTHALGASVLSIFLAIIFYSIIKWNNLLTDPEWSFACIIIWFAIALIFYYGRGRVKETIKTSKEIYVKIKAEEIQHLVEAQTENEYVKLNHVIIPKQFICNMSKGQKRRYLMITNMLRDLNLLHKLLLFSGNNKNSDEATTSANVTISFFVLKTLISKNHEMWVFFKNEKLNEESFNSDLSNLQREVLKFFGATQNENIFYFIRNKFGFHYESDPKHFKDIESLINEAMNSHEMDMWLSSTDSGNEIFSSSNAIMFKVIFEEMRKNGFEGDEQALMNKLFELTTKASQIFQEFYKIYLIEIVLEGAQHEDKGEFKVKAPLLSEVNLPLIVRAKKNVKVTIR